MPHGDLKEKCPSGAQVLENVIPSKWLCLGSLWNLSEWGFLGGRTSLGEEFENL